MATAASPLPQHPSASSQTTPTHTPAKLPSESKRTPMQELQQTHREASPVTTPERHVSPSPPPPIPSQSGIPLDDNGTSTSTSTIPIPLASAVESLNINGDSSNQEDDNDDDDEDGNSSRSAVLTDAAPRVPSSSSSADNAGPDTDTDHHPTPSEINNHVPLAVAGPAPIIIDAPTTTTDAATATVTSTLKPPSTISAAAKPKSKAPKRIVRPPSPPPRPPPPRQTVRLDIPLRGPNEYEVNILQLARDTHQRPLTPPPPPRDGSDDESSSSDDDNAGGVAAGPDGLPKMSIRRRKRGYDLDDPFIDDSDLFIDAPTHFAQTKQQGFYVSSGDVALVKDKSPKKPTAAASGKGGAPIVAQAQAALGLGVDLGGRSGKAKGPSLAALLANATAVAEAPAKVAPMTTIHGEVINAPALPSAAPQPPQTPNGSRNGAGTRESPIALLDDEEGGGEHRGRFVPPQFIEDGREGGAKRIKIDHDAPSTSRPSLSGYGGGMPESASMVSMGGGGGSDAGGTKKRKISKDALEQIFHPDVTEALRGLKAAVDGAAWSQKGKFPPQLKPVLQQVAVLALRHGDYNDDFFDYLPTIFPYNRFTMMKLTSRLMYNEHQAFLDERQRALLEELRQIAIEDFPKAQEDYAKASASWEERQKRKLLVAAAGGVLVGDGAGEGLMDVDSRGPSPGGAGAAVGTPADADAAPAGASKREEKAPVPRYKWTEPIKARVWGLVHLSNEMVRLAAQMAQWDKEFQNTITDHSKKKELYGKIVAAFPDGWMNTGVISREISAMKAKLKKESEVPSGVVGGGAVSGGDVSS